MEIEKGMVDWEAKVEEMRKLARRINANFICETFVDGNSRARVELRKQKKEGHDGR